MSQVFAQPQGRFHPWVIVTPGAATQVEYWQNTTLIFTDPLGGTIANDVIPEHTPATVTPGGSVTFDNHFLYIVYTVAGSRKLSLCLASDVHNLDALTSSGKWALLGRVLPDDVVDYEQ